MITSLIKEKIGDDYGKQAQAAQTPHQLGTELTQSQGAEEKGVSESTIAKWCRDKKVNVYKHCGSWKIYRDEVWEAIEAKKHTQGNDNPHFREHCKNEKSVEEKSGIICGICKEYYEYHCECAGCKREVCYPCYAEYFVQRMQ